MRFGTGMQIGAGSLLSALILTGMPHAANAQNPQDILKKLVGVYKSATTFQGTVITQISGKDPQGKTLSAIQSQAIKYKSPNKMRMEVTQSGTGQLAAQMKKAGKQTAVSDGKTAILYSSGTNQYMKIPSRPQQSLVDLMRLQLPPTVPGATLEHDATVNGRAAFVVKITPRLSPDIAKLPPDQQKLAQAQFKQTKPTLLMVDKQNYHLLKIERTVGTTKSVTTYNHTLNAAIPDSAFAFTPPAGAKEMKPQAQPPMGGGGVPRQ